MKGTQVFGLLAGLLALPLCPAATHLSSPDVSFQIPSACQPKTITISAINTLPPSQTPTTQFFAGSSDFHTGTKQATPIQPTFTTNAITPDSAKPQYCHHDDCLREFMRFSTTLGPFCRTYTTTINPSTQGGAIPTLYNCPGPAARVSSACTCLDSLKATSTALSTSSTFYATSSVLRSSSTTRGSWNSSTKQTTYAGTTTVLPSQIMTTLRSTTRLPTPNLLTGTGISQVTKIPTVTPKWTNSTTVAGSTKPTYIPSGTDITNGNTTTIRSLPSSTSTTLFATETVLSKWVSLPVNEGIKKCHSKLFYPGFEVLLTITQIAKLAKKLETSLRTVSIEFSTLVTTQQQQNVSVTPQTSKYSSCAPPFQLKMLLKSHSWTSTTNTCLECVEKFLPERVSPESPPSNLLADGSGSLQRGYCNVSDQYFYRNIERFLRIGQSNTATFQSPIYLWNMKLLDEPVPYLRNYNDTLYKFKQADEWSTFPISPRSKKVYEDCLSEFSVPLELLLIIFIGQEICTRPASIFKRCMNGDGSEDTWPCFCQPPEDEGKFDES